MANPPRFLALLRGINVGGKNIIAKDDLRRCFEDSGLTSVRTYIQSGNVLFRSGHNNLDDLTKLIEDGLSKRFSYSAQAVILPHKRYRAAVQAAPADWGKQPDWKHNALFVMRGVKPKQVLSELPAVKDEIEVVTVGPGVIYWSASKKHQTKTTMMKLPKAAVYQQLTIRNHNTVFKLLELFDEI